ncbi:hypothetical protein MSAN_01978600 [Mycena sanguinolenta]|uniref:Uncharacterized protein n=1 Tax=Mycena sanguinolenta TaxID=230812 RepID=A0A8H6XNF4_9AGAR|nr:hypothetical protein MSAN_01978600 [Mycena sanguinolenta]
MHARRTRSYTVKTGHPPTPPLPTKPRASGKVHVNPNRCPSPQTTGTSTFQPSEKSKKKKHKAPTHNEDVPSHDADGEVPAPEKSKRKKKIPPQNEDVVIMRPASPNPPARPAVAADSNAATADTSKKQAASTSAVSPSPTPEETLTENQRGPSASTPAPADSAAPARQPPAPAAPPPGPTKPAAKATQSSSGPAAPSTRTKSTANAAEASSNALPPPLPTKSTTGGTRLTFGPPLRTTSTANVAKASSSTAPLPAGDGTNTAALQKKIAELERQLGKKGPSTIESGPSRPQPTPLYRGAAARHTSGLTTTKSLLSGAAVRYPAETDPDPTESFADIDDTYYDDDTTPTPQVKMEPIITWDESWLGPENITNLETDDDTQPPEPQNHHAPADEQSSRVDSGGNGSSDEYEDLGDELEDVDDDKSENSTTKATKKTSGKRSGTKPATRKAPAKAKPKVKATTKGKAKAKGRARAKGKGKETTEEGGDEENSDEELEDKGTGKKSRKRGPIPAHIQERAIAIQDQYYADIDALAEECGKPATALLEMLGTIIKRPRKSSPWNVWQSRYAETNPYDGSVTTAEYTAQSRAAYEKAMRFDKTFTPEMAKDSEAVFKHLPALKEWRDKLEKQAVAHLREKGKLRAKIQKEMQPVLHISEYLLCTYGVWLTGYLIDPHNEASHSFGAGRAYEIYKEQENIEQRVIDLAHILGNIDLKLRGGTAHALPAPADSDEDDQQDRDRHRHLLSTVLGKQLYDRCREVNPKLVPGEQSRFRMNWKGGFCDLAWAAKCRLINHPTALNNENQIIGDNFNMKKIKANTFKEFMPDFIQANRPQQPDDDDYVDPSQVMAIVPWNVAQLQLPLERQREIPLVVSDDGTALRSVKHSAAYDKAVEQERRKKLKARKTQSNGGSTSAKPQPPEYDYDQAQDDDDQVQYDDHQAQYDSDSDHATNEDRPLAVDNDYEPRLRRPIVNNHHQERDDVRVRSKRHGHHGEDDERYEQPNSRRVEPHGYAQSRAVPSHHAGSWQGEDEGDYSGRQYPAQHGYDDDDYDGERYVGGSQRSPPCAAARAPASRPQASGSRPRGASVHPRPRTGIRPAQASSHPPSRREHPPQPKSYQRLADSPNLPHIDLAAANVGSKRKREHPAAAEDSAQVKRQKMAEVPGPRTTPKLLRCRFVVDKEDPKRGAIWYANGLTSTPHPTTADRYTYIHHEERQLWMRMPANMTPIIYGEEERARYQKEVEIHALY